MWRSHTREGERMEGDRFDLLARAWTAPRSRRRMLGGLLGGALAAGLRRPEPAAAAREWTEEEIIQIIRAAARRYNQPFRDMLRVAECESNLDPRAVNRTGPWYGLYQFHPDTWATTPYANKNWFN